MFSLRDQCISHAKEDGVSSVQKSRISGLLARRKVCLCERRAGQKKK